MENFDSKDFENYRNVIVQQLKSQSYITNTKNLAINFKVGTISVDLLVTGKLPNGAMGFIGLKSESERQHMSASVATLQRNFIGSQSEEYKDMVRVAKYWRNLHKWSSKANRPSSYLLELVMLHAYQNTFTPGQNTYKTTFHRFLTLLCDPVLLLSWNVYYSTELAHMYVTIKQLPMVVDPTNPTNNVAARVKDWQEITTYVQQTLAQFQEIVTNSVLEQFTKEMKELTEKNNDMEKKLSFMQMILVGSRSIDVELTKLEKKNFKFINLDWSINFDEKMVPSLKLESTPPIADYSLTIKSSAVEKSNNKGFDYSDGGYNSYLPFNQTRTIFNSTPLFTPSRTHLYLNDQSAIPRRNKDSSFVFTFVLEL